MGDPNTDKAAIVAEVREKFDASDGALLTEYRGLDVPALAALRKELRAAGGEYKIYKNTLVRIAAREQDLDLDDLLTGPTAVAFVNAKEDGSAGDAAAVAKALKEFAKSNENLVLKGGVLDGAVLTNPYSNRRMDEAIESALEMDEDEQRDRMSRMTDAVESYTVSDWADEQISGLSSSPPQ